MLIGAGANATLKENLGHTAYDWAVRYDYTDVASVIKESKGWS